MRTLELVTDPLTDLFPRAVDPVGVRLDAAAVAHFEEHGWCGPVDVLSPAQLAAVRSAVDEVTAALDALEPHLYEVEQGHRDRPGEVVCHFLGGWRVHPVLHDLIRHERVTQPLAQLLGVDALRFWHDQVFAKPPRHPGVVPWHQDYSYWTRTTPARHITMNVVLDDTDLDNGCLHFVSGSHRWGLLPSIPFDAPLESIREHLPEGARFEPVAAPARAGQATIHASHTLHGSPANRSDRPRRAAVLNYMAADTRVAEGAGSEPLLRGTPPLRAGALVDGPFFPVVTD